MKMDKEKINQTEEQTEVPKEKTELEKLSEELENLQKAKDELYDKYLRTLAEYDNFRKRSQREKDAIYGDATVDTVKKLLPVLDNFERALNYECKDEEFKKGIALIQNTLKEVFENIGVTEIPSLDEQFDPNLHEAVMHIDNPAYGENIVTDVYRKGYMLGDKVIRHTMVVVAN
ncbi:MAG: nucleotide exchange factor GrpE [Oscillospiraceae bacterium]|nr:nucleotide exchange factor GrpE [Oscillospiraceae bacterium]